MRRRRALYLSYLTNAGLRVSEAHASSALADAATTQPDLIVLDFGCDGHLITQLKQHPQTQHIPVIALVELSRKVRTIGQP